jgi:hypothetical protein
MDSREIREAVLAHLARGVPASQARFDPKSGRLRAENGGWAVTNQDVILPLAAR